jgi:hypothetical protein
MQAVFFFKKIKGCVLVTERKPHNIRLFGKSQGLCGSITIAFMFLVVNTRKYFNMVIPGCQGEWKVFFCISLSVLSGFSTMTMNRHFSSGQKENNFFTVCVCRGVLMGGGG